jgi:hypothetical protein
MFSVMFVSDWFCDLHDDCIMSFFTPLDDHSFEGEDALTLDNRTCSTLFAGSSIPSLTGTFWSFCEFSGRSWE